MQTEILRINPASIEFSKIRRVSEIIKNGGVVAFPTETVYGVAADAFNEKAIRRVFEVKKRPLERPLPIQIGKKEEIFRLTRQISKVSLRVIEEFFPGPLTLILKKSKYVLDIVSAGNDTVAIRMPDDDIALHILREVNIPLVVPSANIFSKPPAATALEVKRCFENNIDIIVDGGKTKFGISSTILDLTDKPFRILRIGCISKETIEQVIHTDILLDAH